MRRFAEAEIRRSGNSPKRKFQIPTTKFQGNSNYQMPIGVRIGLGWNFVFAFSPAIGN
jgi:hypothetical protein